MSIKFDFNAAKQTAEKQYNLGKGEYFKVKEGDNKIRLISECLPHESEYKGQKTFKWLCQIIDWNDNKIKPYFMPHSVYLQICSLQMDKEEGYDFDEVPMPYNINVVTVNAGDKSAKYTVRPSPKRVELSIEMLKAISEAPTVQEVQAKVRENDSKKQSPTDVVEQGGQEGLSTSEIENIPF